MITCPECGAMGLDKASTVHNERCSNAFVIRIQRCAGHPKASVLYTTDRLYRCSLCDRVLSTERLVANHA